MEASRRQHLAMHDTIALMQREFSLIQNLQEARTQVLNAQTALRLAEEAEAELVHQIQKIQARHSQTRAEWQAPITGASCSGATRDATPPAAVVVMTSHQGVEQPAIVVRNVFVLLMSRMKHAFLAHQHCILPPQTPSNACNQN